MADAPQTNISQTAIGNANAQAAAGGTAIVNAYQLVPPQPIAASELAAAEAKLAALPRDRVPDQIAPLPPGSRMPFRPNPLFVGRDTDLLALSRGLTRAGSAAIGQIAAATGLGGIGKTQLAIEFVHRYGQYFAGGVFWMNFAEPAEVAAEVAACGRLGLLAWRPDYAGLKLEEQVALVQSAWASPLPRLLVFDNCESEPLLMQWHPTTGGCRVLLTSRRADWEPTLGVAALALDVLPRTQSMALLRQFRPDLPADDPDLSALAETLGDLPLALHLAGGFLRQYQATMTPASYLAELHSAALLNHESLQGLDQDTSPTNHVLHIGRTFALSFDRLDRANPVEALAVWLLARAATLAPGVPIPNDLLVASARPADLAESRRAERALRRLLDLGLLAETTTSTSTMHRLVAQFVTANIQEVEALSDVARTFLARAEAINALAMPSEMLVLQPHLRVLAEAAQANGDALSAALDNALGDHLRMLGDLDRARPYLERALERRQKTLEPADALIAQSLQNLGDLLEAQGQYQAAKPLVQRALAIRVTALGNDHPATTQSQQSLAEIEQELEVSQMTRVQLAGQATRHATLPAPTGPAPYHLSLDRVLPPERLAVIQNSGRIVIHMIGSTGGIRRPELQMRVAQAMIGRFAESDAGTQPAFFYHLGDIVFFEGSPSEYQAQFYRPYADYPGPIFAIPGNHDRLPAFMSNFCAPAPRITPSAGDTARKAMNQPDVFWTLQAPFVTIIGLYSGRAEGGQVDGAQAEWLVDELRQAPADKALIIAAHHAVYSADVAGRGSGSLQRVLDSAFELSGRRADAVISAHVMNYQRFTRTVGRHDIPYIIAGAGGYYHLHRMRRQPSGAPLATPAKLADDLVLESSSDDRYGFLELAVSADQLSGQYFTVAETQPHQPPTVNRYDAFTLDLHAHRLH